MLCLVVFVFVHRLKDALSRLRSLRQFTAKHAGNVAFKPSPNVRCSDRVQTKKYLIVQACTLAPEEVTNATGLSFRQEDVDTQEEPFLLIEAMQVKKQILHIIRDKDGSVQCYQEGPIFSDCEGR